MMRQILKMLILLLILLIRNFSIFLIKKITFNLLK